MPLINLRLTKTRLQVDTIPQAHVDILQAWRESIDNKSIFKQNETSLDGHFIQKILIEILGYNQDLVVSSPLSCQGERVKNPTPTLPLTGEGVKNPFPPLSCQGEGSGGGVAVGRTLWKNKPVGSGNVDVALGDFSAGKDLILAPLELKGAKTKDLDAIMPGRHKSPVQQAWEYANDAPGAQWVLVSNYLEIRLYAVGYGRQQYETWDLARLTEPLEYARFQWLLNAKQLLSGATRAILEQSAQLETEITNKLYSDYRQLRELLLRDLPAVNPQVTPLELIRLSQTILDRVLFIAFAEDRGLLPDKTIANAFNQRNPYVPQPIWDNFKGLFRAIDSGNPALKIAAYNGGLFAIDTALESLVVSDAMCEGFKRLADYDFATEVSVTVLGHIFEQSISDIEDLQAQARGELSGGGVSKRKQHGVVYTPDYITNFIVEHTLGKHLQVQFTALWEKTAAQRRGGVWKNREQETEFWRAYQQVLRATRVLDPACGSGAFLVAAFDRLHEEYQRVNTVLADLTGGSYGVFDLDKEILNRNLYGVDVNAESIEITKLSLWLKTAKRGKVLNDLQDTIQVGNSLIDDPAYTDKPFVWTQFAVKNPTPQPPPLDRRGGVKNHTPDLLLTGEGENNPSDGIAVSFPISCQGEGVGGGVAVSSLLSCQGEGGQGGGVDFGFDVILGNPPYVRQELLVSIKPYLQQHYKVYNGNADLYTYFFELGLNLLKPGGRLGYISSNTFFKTGSGVKLRQLLQDNASLEVVVDFDGLQIFSGVTVCTAILTMLKVIPVSEHYFNMLALRHTLPADLRKHFTAHATTMPQASLDTTAWRLENSALVALRRKITADKPTLKQVYGTPLYGIKTGLNEAFIIDQTTRDALIQADPKSTEVLKPFLEGKDLKKWHSEPRNLWLIFARQGINIANYPAVLNHLTQFRNRLEPKPKNLRHSEIWHGRAPGHYKWYELQSTIAYYSKFDKPKILYPDISQGAKFQFDISGKFFSNTAYFITADTAFLVGILNSNLLWFYLQGICGSLGNKALRLFTINIETIPIPPATATQKLTIDTLAEQCQTIAEQRYAKQQAVRQRIPDLATRGTTTPKLTTKLHDWWLLDFPQFRQEIKKCFKQDIPLVDRNDWEQWLTKERTTIDQLTAQLKIMEQELNTQVYQLFDLTAEEIKLVEQV